MHLIYNISIILFGSILKIASVFNPKAKLWIDGRNDFFKSLPDISNENVYWFHCASLGEFDQALPIINSIKERDWSIFILVTFFSPSGFLHFHKRNHKADYVCYLPLDTPSNARKFIFHFKPKKVFFVKYEYWANYIFEAKKSGAKIYSISALFRADHRFFKRGGRFFRLILKQFDYFFVQNKNSSDLLNSIGITNNLVTGDSRFDRVIENKNAVQLNPLIESFLNKEKAFVIGSSWTKDEEILIPLLNSDVISQKIIIAPHDVSENHISQIIYKLKIPFVKFSDLEKGAEIKNEKVLIIDTIGQLANAYYFGSFSYIGGGFTGSLHNILEPAVFGLPVIFGPKHSRFPEGEMFINEGIGFSIKTSEDLIGVIKIIESNLEELNLKTIDFVNSQAGATLKILNYLEKIDKTI